MNRFTVFALLASVSLISACITSPHQPIATVESIVELPVQLAGDGQLNFELSSGHYACEHGLSVSVERELGHRLHLGWKGGRYQLDRDPSYSGLPRFEDKVNGLVWIDLPWKGVLLDGKSHKPLANDCTIA